ncbi:MAG: winged helix-turn-helix domain-containing protein, partial [Pseudomonadales bacterium]
IAALFRRIEVMARPVTDEDEVLKRGNLLIDSARVECLWMDKTVDLTLTEFWMVYSLARRIGHVKSRQQLMQESQMVVDDTTITSHIKRIRKKFEAIDDAFDCIETVYGMGYRWRSGKNDASRASGKASCMNNSGMNSSGMNSSGMNSSGMNSSRTTS